MTALRPDTGLTGLTPALASLVCNVRGVVARRLPAQDTADAVGSLLRPVLAVPDLLTEEQREGDTDGYRQHVLHVEPDGSFSVVALVWLHGQSTAIHDHVSWCTVGVYEGRETETRYRVVDHGGRPRLVRDGGCVNLPGEVSAVAPPSRCTCTAPTYAPWAAVSDAPTTTAREHRLADRPDPLDSPS
jgi:predicted metal-dependent enzyme (double-stranded beta helix superfamily)